MQIELTVPKKAEGTLRLFIIDPDNFDGGRKQEVFIGDKSMGTFDKFQEGRWVEARVTGDMTTEGKLMIKATNRAGKGNAVISIIEWVAKQER
ncbi:MAG: hypothetical protein QUV05_00660 [Phycisphaerae bacterium]|nr:hypothetical protein [Phycisphaerae bacterium]